MQLLLGENWLIMMNVNYCFTLTEYNGHKIKKVIIAKVKMKK